MSYEPTVWKPGDKITSRRMNKLEEGLAGVETGGVYLVKNLDETVEGKALDATVGPGIRDRLTALESASSVVLEGRVDQLEDDLATTNSNVSTLSSSLSTTNTNVSTLDTNIQGVASRITTVEDDISDINDAMAVPAWDSAEETITFTSDDDAQGNATSWTSVPLIESGEKHKSIFNKFTTMVKNIRYLYNMLGTTDISSIGSGTVTSALGNLNTRVGTLNDAIVNSTQVSTASVTTSISYLTVDFGYIRKVGKTASITCSITTSAQMNAWTQAGHIPDGFRPVNTVNVSGVVGSSGDAVRVQIAPNGIINFGKAMTANSTMYFSACYVCA